MKNIYNGGGDVNRGVVFVGIEKKKGGGTAMGRRVKRHWDDKSIEHKGKKIKKGAQRKSSISVMLGPPGAKTALKGEEKNFSRENGELAPG